MRRLLCLSCALLFLLLPTPAAAQEDVVEFGRLATEQRRIAEQLRRLDSLLEVLEERDREEGRSARAERLAEARRLLGSADGETDLAAVVEGLAREIGAMHSGNALEGQQEIIGILQQLLDFLIENEQRERDLQQRERLEDELQGLKDLVQKQQDLLERSEELLQEAEQDPSGSAQQHAKRQELGQEQGANNQQLEDMLREQRRDLGRTSPDLERASEQGEKAEQELKESAGRQDPQSAMDLQSLQEAIEAQKQALDALQEAQQMAQDQLDRIEKSEQQEALLDVEKEAERILAAHLEQEAVLSEILAGLEGDVVPRSARSKLRLASGQEEELGAAADELLVTIDLAGADSFPFFLNILVQDHYRLAERLGPPRYQADARSLDLSAEISAGWRQLIDAIRTERERIRRSLEQSGPSGQPGSPQEEKEKEPLVGFALELQLLKRMQASIGEQLAWLHEQQQAYLEAGLEMGPEESTELELLLDRQKQLQLQFQSMVQRLSGADEVQQEEEI